MNFNLAHKGSTTKLDWYDEMFTIIDPLQTNRNVINIQKSYIGCFLWFVYQKVVRGKFALLIT